MSDDAESRIASLEERVAHQTAELEILSDLVRQQWARIDDLTTVLGRFRDRLTEVEEAGTGPHINTRPPHY